MKICFFGLGSIGKRHIKNLTQLLSESGENFQIDAFRSSGSIVEEEIGRLLTTEYYHMDDLPDDYDIIFVTNPTGLHYQTIESCIDKTRHMFIEKPIFDSLKYRIEDLDLKEGSVYYVACPLRYTKTIRWLKDYIQDKKVYAARVICSSYLPDWRPATDYRKSYSARKELGGGVSIDLIHEWDYVAHLFGMPESVGCFKGTYSDLEITSDDVAVYLGQYKDKLVSMHLDYFGRAPRRNIELFLENDVLVCDLFNNKAEFLYSKKNISLSEGTDDYQRTELGHFLDIIDGKCENSNDISKALKVLSITKGEF